MEEKLTRYITSKCYEVKQLKEFYEDCRIDVINWGHELDTESAFSIGSISNKVEWMNRYYNQYYQGYRDISQLCHKLGGDYLELFKNILRG